MNAPRRYLLEGPDGQSVRRLLVGELQLAENVTRSWVTLTRTGSFTDPRYGRFEITATMLAGMVRNFEGGTFGQDVFIDVAHRPEDGAAGKILQLKADGNRLRAEVEWTPYGLAAVREKGYRYLSADFFDDYIDNEQGASHGPLLRGAGLTIRPVIKRLDPVLLAESPPHSGPVYLSPGLVRQLTEDLEMTMNKRLEELKRRLGQKKLAEGAQKALLEAFERAAKNLGEDDAALNALVESLDNTGTQLAEAAPTGAPITLSVATGLSQADVDKAVAKALAEQAESARKVTESREAKVASFNKLLSEAKGLSEDTIKQLSAAGAIITADWNEASIKQLAENQIALGNQLEAARQLSTMGFAQHVHGSPHITVDDSNNVKRLAEATFKGLRSSSFGGSLRAPEPGKEVGFAAKVLAEFDRANAAALHREARQLASGAVDSADMTLPPSYQREVIRESLHDLRILDLVMANVDPTNSATHSIPYETRDKSQIRNGGVVYEGQPIHKAGISQATELAYIQQMKLALEITNEAAFFSPRNGLINFDAYARNLDSNARAIRELLVVRVANEMQRNADAYGAVAVSGEDLEPQSDGSTSIYKTAQWPIVRPYQARDLKGNAVGSPEHPLTVTYDSVALAEYDGSGAQAAGTYYRVTNWNLGYIQLVNQVGAPVNGVDTTAFTVSYSYATNVQKVDIDVPGSTTYERHMNKLLQAVGARKAVLSSERYVMPDFGLMSPVLHNMITDAENFEAQASRADMSITSTGTLGAVKGIGQWDTNAPGIDLGDERLILGRRGDFRYTVARPFSTGTPFELFDSSQRPLGKRAAYGEEYSSLKVPTRLREGYTSIIAYSANARAAV